MATLVSRARDALNALMGVSTYALPPQTGTDITDPSVQDTLRMLGGQLQPLPVTKPRWYLSDIEIALSMADKGNLTIAAQLARSMRRDGVIGGLTKTRTAGLVALPKRFRGDPEAVDALQASNGTRSVFDEMFPPAELGRLAADGLHLGVGVGQLVPVKGRDFPILVRLEPEHLYYQWNEDRWYYRSVASNLAVTPGENGWILHVSGGRTAPWQDGLWPALGRAFVIKEHALLNRQNFSNKLANPARVAQAPNGATEEQEQGLLQALIRWGVNTVIQLPVGWEAKILESTGGGWQVFGKDIETADNESMITLAGQVVTVTGGSGFANADIHKTIRADLIRETADALAHTLNTQGIPQWMISQGKIDVLLSDPPRVSWDTDPPKDRLTEAQAYKAAAKAITALNEALEPKAEPAPMPPPGFGGPDEGDTMPAPPPPEEPKQSGLSLDIEEMCRKFGIPVTESDDSEPDSDSETATAPPETKPK